MMNEPEVGGMRHENDNSDQIKKMFDDKINSGKIYSHL